MVNGRYFVVFVLLVWSIGLVNGQVKDPAEVQFETSNSRYVDGLLNCACSSTNRGQEEAALTSIKASFEKIKGVFDGDGNEQVKRVTAFQIASTALSTCVEDSSYEACINVADNMRSRFSGMPLLCKYDSDTGKNVFPIDQGSNKVKTLGPCSTDKQYASTALGGVITASKAPGKPSATPTSSKKVKTSPSSSKKPKPSPSKSARPKPSTTSTAAPSTSPTPSVTLSPSPSTSPTNKSRPCIATSWLLKRGLMDKAINHGGKADVLCIPGLPCGTPGHILRKGDDGTLVTYREVCSERNDCTSGKTEVSQLSHEYNWSVFVSGELSLTSLSANPYSTTWSVSRRLAWLADRMNKAGYGRVCNMMAMIPHRLESAMHHAKLTAIVNGRS